jgi:hypothetical protein
MNILLPSFTAKILGGLDSLPDYQFPISYYTNNKRDSTPSYYNCVAPYSVELLDAFTDRPSGDIEVYRGGVLYETFNVDTVMYNIGGRNKSITVTGSKQTTNTTPVEVPLSLSQIISEGRDSYGRTVLNLVPTTDTTSLRPGDSVLYQAVSRLILLTAFSSGSRVNTSVLTLEELTP